jgi:hypothetical protein
MNLREMVGECELDPSGSGWGAAVDPCEHDNEPSGSFLTSLMNDLASRKDCALWGWLVSQSVSQSVS